MTDSDSWSDLVISVPRPIPRGYMVGMRDEVRDGKHYVVEFLEAVPRPQSDETIEDDDRETICRKGGDPN